MGLLPRLNAALLALALAGAAQAKAPASPVRLSVDARVELLGVVQYLAGRRRPVAGEDLSALEARFGALRGHGAVKAYAAAAARGREPYGLLSLFLTEPPDLRWQGDPARLNSSFVDLAGGREALEGFLVQLRDFSRASDFPGFFRGSAPERRRAEAAARAELDGRDIMAAIEAYVGRGLDSRVVMALCLWYSPGEMNSYITPYPYQGPGRVSTGPFTVLGLVQAERYEAGRPFFGLGRPPLRGAWTELLHVAVEPAFSAHEPEVAALAGLQPALAKDCPPDWAHCANHLVVQALLSRVERKLFGYETPWSDTAYGAHERALKGRLVDYERQRARYPTFQEFYPRLLEALTPQPARR